MSQSNARAAGAAPSPGLVRLAALIAAIGLIGAAAPTLASPVIANSSYQIYIDGEVSGNPRVFNTLFDGLSDTHAVSGQTLTVNEGVTDLGAGRWRITIDLDSGGVDLFPTAGEGAIVGIGTFGDGIDLDGHWYLEDARHGYRNPAGASFTTGNLADDYRAQYFSGAWDGLYPAVNGAFVNGNAGGRGYDHVQFNFTVAQIPEPGAVSLVACALGALAIAGRRRTTVGRRREVA